MNAELKKYQDKLPLSILEEIEKECPASKTRGSADRDGGGGKVEGGHTHHRLCQAFCNLQKGSPPFPRPGQAGQDNKQPGQAGAVPVRRQGPSQG